MSQNDAMIRAIKEALAALGPIRSNTPSWQHDAAEELDSRASNLKLALKHYRLGQEDKGHEYLTKALAGPPT